MSRLAPGLIELNKGLDLNTAKIAAPEGTLLDSLNYEQVDFQGQKRIDGYVRYDGSKGSFIDDFLRTTSFSDNNVSEVVLIKEELLGVVVGKGNDYTDIAIIDETLIKYLTDDFSWGREILNPQEHYEAILEYNNVLRERTTELPGPVAGLHWFRDRLYAVASVPAVEASGYYPNQEYNGYKVLGNKNGILYLATAENVGTVYSDIASFFVSLSEAQAEEELGSAILYGWHFNHLGWRVPFENGVSLYGSLVALNQNRQDVGVQGPSSVVGDNGRPLVLEQNVKIVDSITQVRGWKTSTSPDVYSLDSGALREIDGSYIYADALFSWDGATGSVVAETIDLVEYSAGHTIPVEDV